jgi:hypothetical protein
MIEHLQQANVFPEQPTLQVGENEQFTPHVGELQPPLSHSTVKQFEQG